MGRSFLGPLGRVTTETGGDTGGDKARASPVFPLPGGPLLQPELSEHVSVPTTMPAGAPFHSFIRPYPIRVDAFATPAPADAFDYQVPCLHLLTHSHTDHLTGLSSNSFGATVVCSPAAKEMLLNYEPTRERIAYDKGLRRDRLRPYAKLRIDPIKTKDGKMDYSYARDLLVSSSVGLDTLVTYCTAPDTLEYPNRGGTFGFIDCHDYRVGR